MEKVIGVLEWLGATGRPVEEASTEAVAALGDDVRTALMASDGATLAMAIGARRTMASMVVAPDNEPAPLDPVREPDGDEPVEPDADAA